MGTIERIFHSILFEVLAVSLSILGLMMLTDHETGTLSGTMIVIATIAMGWNYLFNLGFDQVMKGEKTDRTLKDRIIHVILFEAGLLILTIPVMAYLLGLSLLEAFIMDLGVTLFVTFYAFVFNYTYDHARAFIVTNKALHVH
ncbi:PACE efflux transporter [Vibrio breoganii]|uniref:PACE efflux transporter n=1 Tax=Vibrio breoganii TaxID=553239 RepID=UPI0021C28777|nr:PACE efflux transporter [Vibrio breoganii]MDN3715761.1 PACE efflux transporter [Vibrio breoganii]